MDKPCSCVPCRECDGQCVLLRRGELLQCHICSGSGVGALCPSCEVAARLHLEIVEFTADERRWSAQFMEDENDPHDEDS